MMAHLGGDDQGLLIKTCDDAVAGALLLGREDARVAVYRFSGTDRKSKKTPGAWPGVRFGFRSPTRVGNPHRSPRIGALSLALAVTKGGQAGSQRAMGRANGNGRAPPPSAISVGR